jgi:NAD(P)-dependent dehydrogenase (short-subunit alcohol dehydrogenase family)
MQIDLAARSAIVTGAAQGLGLATAACLARAGALVYIADVQGGKAQSAAAALRAEGLRVEAAELDIRERDAVRSVFRRVADESGRLDILVNNASVIVRRMLADVDERTFDEVIGVDLKGTMICMQEASRLMRDSGGGAIVNMCSLAGVIAMSNRGPYSLAKAGVSQLTRLAAFEWAPYGIRVNAIAPGVMLSEDIKATLLADEAMRDKYLSRIPLGRFGEPGDVASLVTFLAADQSSFLTGQTIVLDGGYTLGTD